MDALVDRRALAALIDHTLLAPTATDDDVAALCREAAELDVAAVCVSPTRLPVPPGLLPATVGVAAVVGFPSGAHRSDVKALEAARAVADGATEVDVVIDLGAARAGRWDAVEADLLAVRAAAPAPVRVKAILETAALDLIDPTAVERACAAAEGAGVDMVKTSTGFHPAGGATTAAVARLRAAVGDRLGVKASGGIRDRATAVAMVEAGATRLGCSATRQILDGGTP